MLMNFSMYFSVSCSIYVQFDNEMYVDIFVVDYFVYSDAGIYDRVVVQELIKTVAQSHQLDSTTQKEFKGSINHDLPRHTMFNFSAYYRLYFTESTISSFIVIQSTYFVCLVRYYCKSTNLYNI